MFYGRSGYIPVSQPVISHGFSLEGFSLMSYENSNVVHCLYSGTHNRELFNGVYLRNVNHVTYGIKNKGCHDISFVGSSRLLSSELTENQTVWSEYWEVVTPINSRTISAYYSRVGTEGDGWAVYCYTSGGGDAFVGLVGDFPYFLNTWNYARLYRDEHHYLDEDLWVAQKANRLMVLGKNVKGVIGNVDVPEDAIFTDHLPLYNLSYLSWAGHKAQMADTGIEVDVWNAYKYNIQVIKDNQLTIYGHCPNDFLNIGTTANGENVTDGLTVANVCMCETSLYAHDVDGTVYVKGDFGDQTHTEWFSLGQWTYVAGGPKYCLLVDVDNNVFVLGDANTDRLDSTNDYVSVPPKEVLTEPVYYSKLMAL